MEESIGICLSQDWLLVRHCFVVAVPNCFIVAAKGCQANKGDDHFMEVVTHQHMVKHMGNCHMGACPILALQKFKGHQ
jgi:hypothetical protein